MQQNTVLIADNNKNYLDQLGDYLGKAGYFVLKANSIDTAKIVRDENHQLDIAIIDHRLIDDNNEYDDSGLLLAKEMADEKIPTIILSQFQHYRFIRQAHGWFPRGTPEKITFVGKDEKHPTLLNVIQSLLKEQKIFIVHGRDTDRRAWVKLFMHEIGLDPVVLEDQASGGFTIIQQLEAHSKVDYVIVLMTPDDLGALKSDNMQLRPRARQNVIFELGYFIGKYGLNNVKALVVQDEDDLDTPSDFQGSIYITMDDHGAWKPKIAKELIFAGIKINYP